MSAGKEDSGMSISKYNSEGYPDPTAHGALELIEQEEHALRAFRPIVYICSPDAGDIEVVLCQDFGQLKCKNYL